MPDFQIFRYIAPFILPLILLGVFIHRIGSVKNTHDYGSLKEGVILRHPYVKNGRLIFEVDNLTVATGLFPEYKLGDIVRITVNKDKTPQKNLYYPDIEIIGQVGLLNKISDFRDQLVQRVQKSLPGPHADLVLGMTIGYKDDVPSSYTEMLKRAGIIHVVVVSGYNVSLVLSLAGIFFVRLGRPAFFAGSVCVLLIFLFIVGFDPPIIRAVIMGSISTLALVLGEYKRTLYLLILSGLIMLAVNPSYIADVSFQMTFLATATVVLVSPLVGKLGWILQGAFVIFFVNLAMIPVISYYFGTFSLLGLVSNLLLLWEVPFITILGVILMIYPFALLKLVLILLVDYFLLVCEVVNKFNFGVFQYKMDFPAMAVYYFIFLVLLRFLYLMKADSIEA